MTKEKILYVNIIIIIVLGLGVGAYFIFENNSDMGTYRCVQEENTINGYIYYLEMYPKGKNAAKALDAICAIINSSSFEGVKGIHSTIERSSLNNELHDRCHNAIKCFAEREYDAAVRDNTVDAWTYFIKYVPDDYIKDADSKLVDAAYADAVNTGTIEGWKAYKIIVGVDNYRDADNRIDEIESQQWKNESNAWRLATSVGTISAYNKYLRFHPKGAHSGKAKKKVIDLEVDGIFAGSHGSLPSMDRSFYGCSSMSSVKIHNGTGYRLTIYYSGNTSKKISIPDGQTTTFTLPNGNYRVAASVSSSSVRSYAGRETLTGGGYDADYFISHQLF